MEIKGTFTALVTPFRKGEVDLDSFRELLELQAKAGVEGVVICGCTGEAATLSRDERKKLVEVCLGVVGDKMLVVPGTGTNSTESTIELTREAQSLGAHAAMLITPYYNKPTQEGLKIHFKRVGDATEIPLVLYNVPGRTGVNLEAQTTRELYETGRFVAIKEAGGSVDAVSEVLSECPITVLSGDDALTLPMISLGAAGVVSVVSNIFPEAVKKVVDYALGGEAEKAREMHYQLLPVVRAAFIETNPAPIKAMLSFRELVENELRPPLSPVREESLSSIKLVLDRFAPLGGSRSL